MLVAVMSVNLALVPHHCGKRQGLAAGAGTDVGDLFAGFGARYQACDLRACILNLEPAFAVGGFGLDIGIAGVGPGRRDPNAPG